MQTSTAARRVLALAVTLLLAAGCASGPPASAGSPAHRWTRPSATTTPSPGQPTARVDVTYRAWGFSAMRPRTWLSYPNAFRSPEEPAIGYLSNDALRMFCQHTTSAACFGRFPLYKLSASGVLVTWKPTGAPSSEPIPDVHGKRLSIDGSPARLDRPRPATGACREFGGAVQILGTVQIPHGGHTNLQMTACLGPLAGHAAEVESEALFRSVEFVG